MDGQTYLSQISGEVRPEKKNVSNIFKSKFFIVGAIGVVGLILIMILGMFVGGGTSIEDQAVTLKLRLDNTAEMISEYQPSIKSSELRSISASFGGIVANTSKELGDYLTEAYGYKEGSEKASIKDDEDLHKDGLNEELFKAKITGVLDRIYAHKMAYEISLIVSTENKLANATSSETLKNLLTTSDKSLRVIYDKFDNYSEAK